MFVLLYSKKSDTEYLYSFQHTVKMNLESRQSGNESWFASAKSLFGRKSPDSHSYGAIGAIDSEGNVKQPVALDTTRILPRKVPVKVEPKVYFANERTFLAWMHMSVTLASISVAITAFAESNELSQLYGLLLMPCSIAFCCYSLYIYINRAAMIRRKDPGPYDDKVGPIVLGCMLGCSILVNFFVKLYDMST